jgi:hypothetical protein
MRAHSAARGGVFAALAAGIREFIDSHKQQQQPLVRAPLGLIAPPDTTSSQFLCRPVDLDLANDECHMAGLSTDEAEEVLDWLQTNGYRCLHVSAAANGIEVRWRVPRGELSV